MNQLPDELLQRLSERHGLPLHVILTARMKENAESFLSAASRHYPHTLVCFAAKSNPCLGALKAAARMELGADVASEYELAAALEAGIPASRIVCNGNAKSDAYIRLIARSGALPAIDSPWEIELFDEAARERRRDINVLIRLSGMALEGYTAADQSTASRWTKFGFPVDNAAEVFRIVASTSRLKLAGLTAHIGTQICDPSAYDKLLNRLLDSAKLIRECGGRFEYLDVGGGFPVSYLPESDWAAFRRRLQARQSSGNTAIGAIVWEGEDTAFTASKEGLSDAAAGVRGKSYWSEFPGSRMFERLLTFNPEGVSVADLLREMGEPRLIVEPGRAIIGTAGVTLARVSGVKSILGHPLVAVELGIVNHGTNLITPDIYPFEIRPIQDDDEPVDAFIAGHLCFTGDMISKIQVRLNRMPRRGEMLLIHHTGAYAADHFASNSCGFPRPAKVALPEDGEGCEVWRMADTPEEYLGCNFTR